MAVICYIEVPFIDSDMLYRGAFIDSDLLYRGAFIDSDLLHSDVRQACLLLIYA